MDENHRTAHRIGVLSDTHLERSNELFKRQAETAFRDCDTIIHAGDVTDRSILEVFENKNILAVHGNMCNADTRDAYPESLLVTLAGFSIAVCHGAGNRQPVEQRLLQRFPDADCIIYGHTHHPVNHRWGGILFVNPGSFKGTGRYGSLPAYAILTTGVQGLTATLHELPLMT